MKSSIKQLVLLPLVIYTIISFANLAQMQNIQAADIDYDDSGDDSDTPLASDRFDAIEDGDVPSGNIVATQTVTPPSGSLSDKIDLVLQQFIDCETSGTGATCDDIFMTGIQDVTLTKSLNVASFLDADFDLTMVQKDDTDGQDFVDNNNEGTQTVEISTANTADFDGSHDGNEVNMNMYQYNKRGAISEDLSDYEIDDIQAAVSSSDGSGNDDSNNGNVATQFYKAAASGSSTINVADAGSDQTWTIGQFNADCDGGDDGFSAVNCDNLAVQNIDLKSSGPSQLTFNTLSPIELQQINTCKFSSGTNHALDCSNSGTIDVKVDTQNAGVANVELENPNGQPVLFQRNLCTNLQSGLCDNNSVNLLEVIKTGNSDIEQTNVDWQVAQYNKCDNRVAGSQDCINQGITSGIDDFNGKDLSALGPANNIVYVKAQGANSKIVKADPDGFLKMVNDCSGSRDGSNCINGALNEALFFAGNNPAVTGGGGTIDIDSVKQDSTTTNTCDNLRNSRDCQNYALNTFSASATEGATIDIGSAGSDQKQTLTNTCNNADCKNDGVNFVSLTANEGAIISTTDTSSGIDQITTLKNQCTSGAICDNIGNNIIDINAEGEGSDVDIKRLYQQISVTNTCSGSTTICNHNVQNSIDIDNTSGNTVTADAYQSISHTNSFTSGTHNFNSDNTINVDKTSGSSFSFQYQQTNTASSGSNFGDNSISSTNQAGSSTVSQNGGDAYTFP